MKKLRILIILFVTSFSLFVFSFSYSVYKSESYGNANLSVASWNVELDSDSNNEIDIVSGVSTEDYKLQVKSSSDVSVKYSIELKNIPTGVRVALDDNTFIVPVDNKLTFENAGSLLISDETHENNHTLKFKADLGTQEVNNHNVDIDVKFEQIY